MGCSPVIDEHNGWELDLNAGTCDFQVNPNDIATDTLEGRSLRCLERRSTQSHVALFEYDHRMQYQCHCSGTISERV